MKAKHLSEELDRTSSCVQYSITLSPFLKNKLDNHLQTLKFLHHPEKNRQSWILRAIHQKIDREKDLETISKVKYLGVAIKKSTMIKLERRLKELEKDFPAYSKKQWILEAIEEKLEKEKGEVVSAINKLRCKTTL